MKTLSLIKVLVIYLSFIGLIHAQSSTHDHKVKMKENVSNMESLISSMENETDGWTLRSNMQVHAELMENGVKLAEEMAKAKRRENKGCLKREAGNADGETCNEEETQLDVQYRQMVVLMKHVIKRQNIILSKLGILNNTVNKDQQKYK